MLIERGHSAERMKGEKGGSELDDEAKEILLKQMKLLQEESEKVRENGNLLDRPIDLARLSEAMAQIAGVFFRS